MFAGKVCLITGAASGIGRATTSAFAERGATVILADWNKDQGSAFAEELRSKGHTAEFVQTNVGKPDDCARMVNVAREKFGRLDVAFNNAGISDTGNQPETHDYPNELWQRLLDVDLSGVFYCMKYELPLMLATGGAIVNTASTMAFKRYPRSPAYTSAKSGVVALTQMICNEYAARGIRCNAVAPGNIRTPLNVEILESPQWKDQLLATIPAGRIGVPEDIAEAVIWLCSPAANYVNGVCLPVDGGVLAR